MYHQRTHHCSMKYLVEQKFNMLPRLTDLLLETNFLGEIVLHPASVPTNSDGRQGEKRIGYLLQANRSSIVEDKHDSSRPNIKKNVLVTNCFLSYKERRILRFL